MYRTFSYLLLFVSLVLLQSCLFDSLTVSVFLNPLVYVVFLALLPMETQPAVVLLWGLGMGVVMDWTMGAAGENTIATVFAAFLRPALLNLTFGKDNVHDGGIPSVRRMGKGNFLRYLVTLIVLHHALFFLFESLSMRHLLYVAVQLVVSGAVTLLFSWIIARLFTVKLVRL